MSDKNVEYGLKEPFDIDNGELDGIGPVECFVLGVEWQMVSRQADGDGAFERPIHSANASRLKRMMIRRGRQFRITPTEYEGWQWVSVASKDGEWIREVKE